MICELSNKTSKWVATHGFDDITKETPTDIKRELYIVKWLYQHGENLTLKHAIGEQDNEANRQLDKAEDVFVEAEIMGLIVTDKDGFVKGVRSCANNKDRQLYIKTKKKYPLAFKENGKTNS